MVKKMKLKQKINIDIYSFNIFEKWKDIIECKDEDSTLMREFRSLLMLITIIVFILVYGLIYMPIEYVVLLILGKQKVEEINEKIKGVQDSIKYKDLDYYVELINLSSENFGLLPKQYYNHKEILFAMIKKFPNNYAFFDEEQQSVEGVALLAVSLSPEIFKYTRKGNYNMEVIEVALKKIPSNYYYCYDFFKEDREFMLKILKANPLIYLPLKHFKDDEEFAYFALKRERMIFHFIPKSLKEQYGNNIEDFLYNLSEKFDKEEFYFSKMIRQ
jgi:hypothetical protein